MNLSEKKDKMHALNKESLLLRDEIEKEETKDDLEKAKKLVGKYFAYRKNSYSCPENPEDYWDILYKVLAVTRKEDSSYISLICQNVSIDSYGWVNIETKEETLYDDSEFIVGNDTATKEEYDELFSRAMRELEKYDTLKEKT